eukprot:NODE_3413_length_982_cov_16.956056_g3135_i0.p1 GENE.NODE_3413_length_982_cov_16.956056_g3135_i0~~NODE_3413_length_982_cov_16.956056_g3135_i0.p1  ORF type:complete len:246 (-),score=30.56 NODE_3413_length_982_cov_16.956056_g3135_i0:191-928(-)
MALVHVGAPVDDFTNNYFTAPSNAAFSPFSSPYTSTMGSPYQVPSALYSPPAANFSTPSPVLSGSPYLDAGANPHSLRRQQFNLPFQRSSRYRHQDSVRRLPSDQPWSSYIPPQHRRRFAQPGSSYRSYQGAQYHLPTSFSQLPPPPTTLAAFPASYPATASFAPAYPNFGASYAPPVSFSSFPAATSYGFPGAYPSFGAALPAAAYPTASYGSAFPSYGGSMIGGGFSSFPGTIGTLPAGTGFY